MFKWVIFVVSTATLTSVYSAHVFVHREIRSPADPVSHGRRGPIEIKKPPGHMRPSDHLRQPGHLGPPDHMGPPGDMKPHDHKGPPDHMGPPGDMKPHDHKVPPDHMGPPDHRGPPDHMGPPDHKGPPDHMGPPDHIGPPGKMRPHEHRGPPDNMGPLDHIGAPDHSEPPSSQREPSDNGDEFVLNFENRNESPKNNNQGGPSSTPENKTDTEKYQEVSTTSTNNDGSSKNIEKIQIDPEILQKIYSNLNHFADETTTKQTTDVVPQIYQAVAVRPES